MTYTPNIFFYIVFAHLNPTSHWPYEVDTFVTNETEAQGG